MRKIIILSLCLVLGIGFCPLAGWAFGVVYSSDDSTQSSQPTSTDSTTGSTTGQTSQFGSSSFYRPTLGNQTTTSTSSTGAATSTTQSRLSSNSFHKPKIGSTSSMSTSGDSSTPVVATVSTEAAQTDEEGDAEAQALSTKTNFTAVSFRRPTLGSQATMSTSTGEITESSASNAPSISSTTTLSGSSFGNFGTLAGPTSISKDISPTKTDFEFGHIKMKYATGISEEGSSEDPTEAAS
ncbi:MAG: hypothetical protein JW893_01520 [Candidatus Omnitrophica bacterium]|nr:hypothetical protein [Candidatus Omnitrophota bacterium]